MFVRTNKTIYYVLTRPRVMLGSGAWKDEGVQADKGTKGNQDPTGWPDGRGKPDDVRRAGHCPNREEGSAWRQGSPTANARP